MPFFSLIRRLINEGLPAAVLFAFTAFAVTSATETAHLILGRQIHKSRAWPRELKQLSDSMAALHANTEEAPVYWEHFKPQPGQLDWSNANQTGWNSLGDQPWKAHANNFAPIEPQSREIAQQEFKGKLKTAVEAPDRPRGKSISAGGQRWLTDLLRPMGAGLPPQEIAALVAQLGPDKFLATGVVASVAFHLQASYRGSTTRLFPPSRSCTKRCLEAAQAVERRQKQPQPVLLREAGGGAGEDAAVPGNAGTLRYGCRKTGPSSLPSCESFNHGFETKSLTARS